MLSVNWDGADTSRYKCLLLTSGERLESYFDRERGRASECTLMERAEDLLNPPPPLHQGFHGESSWFPISLSHLLVYQRGAHCLALNY